jgi:hypothetical protein
MVLTWWDDIKDDLPAEKFSVVVTYALDLP